MNRVEFLQNISPFNLLSPEVLDDFADLFTETKYSKDTLIYQQEVTKMKGIDVIVRGRYESFFYDKEQNKRLPESHGSGYCYGGISILLNRKKSLRTVIAAKGTIVLSLKRKYFAGLCQSNDAFFQYFTAEYGRLMSDDDFAHFTKALPSFEQSYIASEQLYSRRIESIDALDILYCEENTPAWQAATLMADHKRSCIIVHSVAGKAVGFITDITLRDKIVAQRGFDNNIAAKEIMDTPVVTIDNQAYVYEAILMMFRSKTRYLLVENKGLLEGIISRNRLLSEQAQSPLVFIQSVKLALSVDELKGKWENVPHMIKQLIGRGVNAEIVNQIITSIADTILIKIIDTVIAEIGKPPAKFVFMVLGSEGRKEQTLKTDQDNAIIYEDKANEHREEVRAYFLKFADMVSGYLDFIGFSFCTGGFMAKNPKWTHSLSHWKNNYEFWLQDSMPETSIKFSTFFDCRYIYGDSSIMDELQEFLDEKLKQPLEKLFFHMAKNALQYQPPLTSFLKNIRTISVGDREVFDIKKAMTPIVDLVRVYALKHRVFSVNTGERIKALQKIGVFSESAVHELLHSYYYLMALRLQKQANHIIQDNTEPNNFIDPTSLTKIEQVTLKEIFKTIEGFQSRIRVEFTKELF
jgi:CBS domain-containing protein